MTASKIVAAAASSGAGGGTTDIDEVFSTYLWEGNNSTQTITNSIDLSGEGGLVWIKERTDNEGHRLIDTVRGNTKMLRSDATGANYTIDGGFDNFTSTGFTLKADNGWSINSSSEDYVSWSFRKAPKFFDVQTWTGNGASDRAISHNLDSVPGMIIVKRTVGGSEDWAVWHTEVHNNTASVLYLNKTDALSTSTHIFGATNPTSTDFYVGDHPCSNNNGDSYVAYVFAHNNNDGGFGPDSDQDIIKCGSYTGNGNSSNGTEVNLGFEPQFLMVKRATGGSGDWAVLDTMRGWTVGPGNKERLRWNVSNIEAQSGSGFALLHTGFKLFDSDAAINGNGSNYIYMAIRRGSLNVPDDATKVFDVNTYTSTGSAGNKQTTGFPVDLTLIGARGGASWNHGVVSRLTGGDNYLATNSSAAEVASGAGGINLDDMTGYDFDGAPFNNDTNMYNLNWKRAPGYFDVVTYTGTGSARTISHNLGVAPEMIWVKNRDAVKAWIVFHKGLNGGTNPATYAMLLSGTDAEFETASRWNNTAPTSSVFSVGDALQANGSGNNMIAYLFATVAGVSKVGSFSPTGSTLNVDCGFSSGARFVLAKQTDSTEGWYLWDSVRGIVAGNDPYLYLNGTGAETTNADYIDPHSSGFTITSTFFGSGNFIFYAIA